jgi:hypothetical protein
MNVSRIPDFSRFENVKNLMLTESSFPLSGLENLPVTLKSLNLSNNTFADSDLSWIKRLVNLEVLRLKRAKNVSELPDLSGLVNLRELDISETPLDTLPSLPANLSKLIIPLVPRYFSESTCKEYWEERNYAECCRPFSCLSKSHTSNIVARINRINRIYRIREELLAKSALIVLNPERIERISEEYKLGVESDWDTFDYQDRREF